MCKNITLPTLCAIWIIGKTKWEKRHMKQMSQEEANGLKVLSLGKDQGS